MLCVCFLSCRKTVWQVELGQKVDRLSAVRRGDFDIVPASASDGRKLPIAEIRGTLNHAVASVAYLIKGSIPECTKGKIHYTIGKSNCCVLCNKQPRNKKGCKDEDIFCVIFIKI